MLQRPNQPTTSSSILNPIYQMVYHPFFNVGVCGEDRRRGEVHVLTRAELRRSEEGGDDMPHAETPAHRGAAGDLLQVNTLLDPDVF